MKVLLLFLGALLTCSERVQCQGTPSTGLYFTLGGTVYNPGSSVNINSIGPQPTDRADSGSTLVCDTRNVNTHCCRGTDNPNGGGQGEWRDPNDNLVPTPSGLNGATNVFASYRYTQQLRLAIVGNTPTGALGVYTCVIPDMSGTVMTATITITDMTDATTTLEATMPPTTPEATMATTTPEATMPPTTPEATMPPTTPEATMATTTPETTMPPTTPGSSSPSPVMTDTPPAPSFMVAITPSLTVLEGSNVSLNCTSDISGTFMWRGSSGSILMTSPDLTISTSDMFSVLTISSVHTSQAGTYTCNVSTGVGSQSVDSNVTVQLMSPSAVEVTSPVVLSGSPVDLTCTITLAAMLDSGVEVLVAWTDPNGATVPGGTTPSGSDTSYTSQVTLTDLKDSDAGTNYTCTTSLMSSEPFITDSSTVSDSNTLSLQIRAPSTVTVTPIRSERSLDLSCSITLDDTLPPGAMVQVMWTGPSGPLNGTTPSGTGSSYFSIVNLTSVSVSDAGTYTCNASISSTSQYLISSTSSAGSYDVPVQIGAPTRVSAAYPTIPLSVGDNILLTCEIDLFSSLITDTALEVTWTLPDNSMIIAGTGGTGTTLTGSGNRYNSTLTVMSVSISDIGTYICSARITSTNPLILTSDATVGSTMPVVQELAPSSVMVMPPTSALSTGDPLLLMCSVMLPNELTSGTSLAVTWTLPDSSVIMASSADIISNPSSSTTSYSAILNITSLTPSHAGIYQCSARIHSTLPQIMSSDSTVNSVEVTVQLRAPSVTVSSSSVIYNGLPYNITCSIELLKELVTGVSVEVTWTGPDGSTPVGTLFGSGTSYSSTVTRTVASTSQEGNYTCAVRLNSMVNYLLSSLQTSEQISVTVVSMPSAPSVNSQTSSTSIILTWTQDAGDVVDSYSISYSFMVIGCTGVPGSVGGSNIMGISGSTRMYTLSNLEEFTEFTITVTAVNRAGSATTSLNMVRTTAAPPVSPSAVLNTATPTSISITWNEIPCLQRNGSITRYIVSICQISDSSCVSNSSHNAGANRMYTFTSLIPRTTYNVSVRADSEDDNFNTYAGFYSSPVTVETTVPEALGFLLSGTSYPRNSAIDLSNIAADRDALRCLTPFVACCRASDTNSGSSLGNWRFPDNTLVTSRNNGADISRTRGPSSVILHRMNNVMTPTGVYTCEIPDVNGTLTELNVNLYVGQLSDLIVQLEYSRQSAQLTCTISGGLVNSIIWTKDGTPVTNSTIFTQSDIMVDRLTVTSGVILRGNISNFVGVFECVVTDGSERTATKGLQINGVEVSVSPIFLTVGQDATLSCLNDAGMAELIEWRTRDGILLSSVSSVAMLEFLISPVNDSLSIYSNEFTCFVTRNSVIYNQTLTPTVSVPSPAIAVNVTSSGSTILGSELNLTCIVFELFSGLTNSPMATWTATGSIPGSVHTSNTASIAVAVININPLRASYPIRYTCEGSLFTPVQNRMIRTEETIMIQPQISTPDASLVVSPGPLIVGGVNDVTLTCTARVNRDVIDTEFGELRYSFRWIYRDGSTVTNSNRTLITSSATRSSSTLTLSPLSSSDTMFYCNTTISESQNRLQSSNEGTSSTNVEIVFPEPPVVNVSSSGSTIAGEMYSLTCHVSLNQNLRQSPVIEWVGPNGPVRSDNSVVDISLTSSPTTRTLSFTPLHTSHGGVYRCIATVTDNDANIRIMGNSSTTVIIEVPAPTITITGSPIDEGFHVGLTLTLTATAIFNSAVDTNLTIVSSWSSPRVGSTTDTVLSNTNPLMYTTTLSVNLQDINGAIESYEAAFNVSTSMFIIGMFTAMTRTIIVEVFPPQVIQVNPESTQVVAGSYTTLVCNATRQSTLSSLTTLEVIWLNSLNEIISTTPDIMISREPSITTDIVITSSLTFTRVRTSLAGTYTCVVNMTIPGIVVDHQVSRSVTLNVQILQATSVVLQRNRDPPLYWGTILDLTCVVNYNTEVVDIPVSFNINITGPATDSTVNRADMNISKALFRPLLPIHEGMFTCLSALLPKTNTEFVIPVMNTASDSFVLQLTELPGPRVSVTSSLTAEAGEFVSLSCIATVVDNLIATPSVEWIRIGGSVIRSNQNPSAGSGPVVLGTVSMLNVSFSPLQTSHAGQYQCTTTIDIPGVPMVYTEMITALYAQIPIPSISIQIMGDSVQGTITSLLGRTNVELRIVDSPIQFITSWTKQDGTVQFLEVADVFNTSITRSPFSSNLTFSPLRNDSVDGGVYVFTVLVKSVDSSVNSVYVLMRTANQTISFDISSYPKLNITANIITEDCNLSGGAELVGSIGILDNTFPNGTVTYTWQQGDTVLDRQERSLILMESFNIPSLSRNETYDLEVCLTIFGSGLNSHCSRAKYDIVVSKPGRVSNLACTSEDDILLISWDSPSVSAVSYRVSVKEIIKGGNSVTTTDLSTPFLVEVTGFSTRSPELSKFVPYSVEVMSLDTAKCGTISTITCFTQEGVPERSPNMVQVSRDPDDVTILIVTWEPLNIVEARGFITYIIVATPSTGSRKRQNGILMDEAASNETRARITGANPDVSYAVVVSTRTGSGISGPESDEVQIEAASSPSGSPITIIIVIIVIVLIILILVVVAIILVLKFVPNRGKKGLYSPDHYTTSVTATSHPYDSMELKYKDTTTEGNDMSKELEANLSTEVVPDKEPVVASVAPVEVMDRMKPVSLESFRDHVASKHNERDKGFETEYQSLGSDPVSPHTVAKLPHNRVKNRFANIFPYDNSRVILPAIDNVEGSDYINACTIDGYNRSGCYIAAQGPMPNTETDFWRMIWEMKLNNIVMLTKCMEAGRRKCEQYWAENIGEVYETSDKMFTVTTTSIMPFADFIIRTFSVRHRDVSGSEMKVTQYHFTSWPDHGVPKFATSLLSFIRRVQKGHNKDLGVPLLVHCSAGVGRTGTFITLDAMLERIRSDNSVNVYEFVKNMRKRRVLMVQTMAQYVFIHDALNEFIICGDNEIKASNLRAKVNSLGKVIPGKAVTGFGHQFELLEQISRVPLEEDCTDAAEHYNRNKNRYPDKPPYNLSRARLRPTGEEGSEYINASFIDGYKQRNAYIATQGPLPHTVDDVWRLIWEFKSKTLVTLCQPIEDQVEVCRQFWPSTANEPQKYGKITVTLQSSTNYDHFEVRKFLLNDDRTASTTSRNEGNFILTQFHHLNWPEKSSPSTGTLIEMLDMITKVQMSTGNRPITVMCNDGVGRSGTFLCVHSQLERLKTEGVVDVFQAVKSARNQRGYLMPETHQFAYAHQVLADYMDKFDNYANFKDMI